jgi:nucleoside-triphosphatase
MKILITALPGTGKSTVIDSVVSSFPGHRHGIVAREILDENGRRDGFASINTLGESRQFMFRTDRPTPDSVGGEFDVDIEAIDTFVVPELQKALCDRDSLTYIDEIGRAQAKSQAFLSTVRTLFATKNNILGAILYDDEPWSLEFKGAPGICIIEVTAQNRNALPEILLAAFGSAPQFSCLTTEQQRRVFIQLKDLLRGSHFIAARKLFSNSIPYVVEKRIQLLKEKPLSSKFVVSGQSRKHIVGWNSIDKSFVCDCDLFNGRGAFKNKSEPCSHQMSILLSNEMIYDILTRTQR